MLLRMFGISDRTILAVSIGMVLGIGMLLVVRKILSDRYFIRSFGTDRGLWYFSSVHSRPFPVDDVLDSAEVHLKELGLRVTTAKRGTPSSGSKFMRIEGTPMMIILSYDITDEDMMLEIEVGPQKRSSKKQLMDLMGSMRDWSVGTIYEMVGELGPDPRDPGTLKI
jgi:hypothetical protein